MTEPQPLPASPTVQPTAPAQPTAIAFPLAESPPTRLVIPSIQLDAPVVSLRWHVAPGSEKVAWGDPGAAAGWLKSSALPGAGSNVVMAGHHNIRGEVFRHLVDVGVGDLVYLSTSDVSYRYIVRERFILPEKHAPPEQRKQNALWVAPTIDERLTLVTCWPYRSNTHRLIVVAKPELPEALTLADS